MSTFKNSTAIALLMMFNYDPILEIDGRAQVDDEDTTMMNIIRSNDWLWRHRLHLTNQYLAALERRSPSDHCHVHAIQKTPLFLPERCFWKERNAKKQSLQQH
ncbi:hypothetical protein CMV_018638 [Castanea mollissima]|uniref:Uncharacterized protein n=1 Tax=Castanea mollissima TaxID=60419 RepID=A0A8J4VPE8_9ROSI|nr:hypothetical protein CMV_018638 [Castanea mollissima]